MDKPVLFLGPLFPPDAEEALSRKKRVSGSLAPNVFQWNLLHGLHSLLGDRLKVVNVLPVGTWPKAYKDPFLKSKDWTYLGLAGHEIGCLNLPFLKQFLRSIKTRRYLKKHVAHGTEIMLYSPYLPFLKAVSRLHKSIKVTVIVTDLPEFYDLGTVSAVRKLLRTWQNRIIDRYLRHVDRFVVLTEQMCGPLKVGDRPWLRIEGICCDMPPIEKVPSEGSERAILYSGTLHYQYGIKNLLNAFSELEDPTLSLWICGSGEAAHEITELSKQDPRIQFFGFCSQQQVADLRAKAAVLINPRTNEGEYTKYSFPSKTMEYMASGKPVIMYKLDGIPDEYDPYLFYASSEDPVDGLKTAICQVMEDYDTALTKSKDARTFVLSSKNGTAQAKKLLEWILANDWNS